MSGPVKTPIEVILERCRRLTEEVKDGLPSYLEEYGWWTSDEEDPLEVIIGAICDQEIRSEHAWEIPRHLRRELEAAGKPWKASEIVKLGRDWIRGRLSDFMRGKWPRRGRLSNPTGQADWLKEISGWIFDACTMITRDYLDDPTLPFVKAWQANNKEFTVPLAYLVWRHFPGIGPKKATMMARDWAFELPSWLGRKIGQPSAWMEYHTEVPIDVHVKERFNKILEGTKLTAEIPHTCTCSKCSYKVEICPKCGNILRLTEVNPQDVQNVARVVYPDWPAIVDSVLWK
jgi:hypothetical protein